MIKERSRGKVAVDKAAGGAVVVRFQIREKTPLQNEN